MNRFRSALFNIAMAAVDAWDVDPSIRRPIKATLRHPKRTRSKGIMLGKSHAPILGRIVSEVLIFLILWNLPTALGIPVLHTVYAVLGMLCITGWISYLIHGVEPTENKKQ